MTLLEINGTPCKLLPTLQWSVPASQELQDMLDVETKHAMKDYGPHAGSPRGYIVRHMVRTVIGTEVLEFDEGVAEEDEDTTIKH